MGSQKVEVETNRLFSQLTTLQIGGPIQTFLKAEDVKTLVESINYAKKNNLNFLVIGDGSNLLVSDEGFDGLVIQNKASYIKQKNNILEVASGTSLQKLVDYATEKGLGGLHKLTGIPGTVGGGVFGNAGAFGQTISDFIQTVDCTNGENIFSLSKEECVFGYRDSSFKKSGLVILEVRFELPDGDKDSLQHEADEVLVKRLTKYPPSINCPGSFFKNIVVDNLSQESLKKAPQEKIVFGKLPAGALLEEVGARGKKLGQIEIMPYHANLFINKGGGKAQDFYNLARKYAQKVKEKFGITLEPEVQLINLPPFNI